MLVYQRVATLLLSVPGYGEAHALGSGMSGIPRARPWDDEELSIHATGSTSLGYPTTKTVSCIIRL